MVRTGVALAGLHLVPGEYFTANDHGPSARDMPFSVHSISDPNPASGLPHVPVADVRPAG
jgi:hypothetical protein